MTATLTQDSALKQFIRGVYTSILALSVVMIGSGGIGTLLVSSNEERGYMIVVLLAGLGSLGFVLFSMFLSAVATKWFARHDSQELREQKKTERKDRRLEEKRLRGERARGLEETSVERLAKAEAFRAQLAESRARAQARYSSDAYVWDFDD